MGPRTWAGLAGALGVLVFSAAGEAAPCPRARLVGPDPELVDRVARHLEPAVSTSTTPCSPIVVEIRPHPNGVGLVRLDAGAGRERVVGSAATAASLIDSWTTPALGGLSWLDDPPAANTEPAEALADATAEGPAGPRLYGTASATVAALIPAPAAPEATPPAPPTEAAPAPAPVEVRSEPEAPIMSASYWSLGARGAASEAASLGAGLELAWHRRLGAWRLAPTLRGQIDRQPGADDESAATGYELALGGRLERRFGGEVFGLGAAVGLLAAYRHVDPHDPVGVIACQPAAPCTVDTEVPEAAAPYHAFAVWAEAGLEVDAWLRDDLGVALGAAFGVAPGHATVGAPAEVVAAPGQRVRAAPRLPRWRATLQVDLRWEGP